MLPRSLLSSRFPYTTLFRSLLDVTRHVSPYADGGVAEQLCEPVVVHEAPPDDLTSESDKGSRSEEHTSELQSRGQLVCRLLLEKKKHHIKRRVLLFVASYSH